jgi:hypothetical protein
MRLQPRTITAAVVASALLTGITPVSAQESSVQRDIETLASELFGGRRAGSEGEQMAADYIAEELTRLGAQPLPGLTSMLVPFDFTAGSRDAGSWISVERTGFDTAIFDAEVDIQALAFSDDTVITGEVVFAGYGLVVPDARSVGYDSYATLDVTGKIVAVLRYFPENVDTEAGVALSRYSGLRYKALAARERGAKALLVMTGPRSPNAGMTVPMGFDTALAGSGIPAASVSAQVADAIFAGHDTSLAELQASLDVGDPHTAGFGLPGVIVTLRTAVERERSTALNVVAYMPATTLTIDEKPWVTIGAHYDHLGRGGHVGSLALQGDADRVHFGADDNASGTAVVLAVARALATQPRERNLILGLWSGEESGLLGSAAFVNEAIVPSQALAAYFNFDMVGRMQDNRLIVQATGTSPTWPALLEQVNISTGFDLRTQSDPYQPTDVATFNLASVPSLSFTTGAHVDYHKPSDTAEKITYEDVGRVVDMAEKLVRRTMQAAEPPVFVEVEVPMRRGSLAGVRITTGTIPDYSSDAEGLRLSGVVAGGPADEAGLQRGDVIIEIAEQTITNVYDYTFALELLRADEPVMVVFIRSEERHETILKPTARP